MSPGVQYTNTLDDWLQYEPSDPLHQLAAPFHGYNFNICTTESCWNSELAPVAAGTPMPAIPDVTGYWPGWDIATKITVIPGADEGYTVDGFGGIHPFGSAPAITPTGYWPNWDIVRGIAVASGGTGVHSLTALAASTPPEGRRPSG
jgi:hypothetical protein